ncbi:MAG TPA: stage V sporulation protein D [Selenomonadales bacterium]|nr:stage V sporulation protein D [Selenomonadales bacterium]
MASVSHVTIRKRAAFLFLFVSCVMVGLFARLVYLQFYKSAWLAENAVDQRVREIPVEARRGIIYDRNGKELAVSVSSESVYAIPAEIRNAEETAAKLAAILALDPDNLANRLKKRQSFLWIKRKVDEDTAMAVKRLNLAGIGLTQESRRHYPYGNAASHILGFTGIDSQGLDGVELTFDSYLKGRPGGVVVEYDARGREIPQATHRYVPPVEGQNIHLTIDIVIQKIAERELENAMRETQAKAASIIVMKPDTGEILALANRPDYDPNNFAAYSPKLWRNNAVSNSYEPGSTFKIVTTAAAMSEKVVRLDERFFDPGFIEVQGRTIHCWRAGGHGSETFLEVVKNSCNPGFVNIGLRLGAEGFYRYINGFGFGKPTGVDLPGEASGIVIDQAKVKPINIATMAMGQSIAVTPMQLITAACAIANGGELLRPQVVREVHDKAGQLTRSFRPDIVTRVLDPNTDETVRGILEKVVEEGTGKSAFIEGFRVAGKTGTAQKVGAGGYVPGRYVASFVGFAPADKPKIAILVVIDEPVGPYYGGVIAAPVFGAVAKDVLQYLDVAPQAQSSAPDSKEAHVTVPPVINFLVADAVKELQKAGLNTRIEETGERVADQVPKPGSRVPAGANVLLYTLTPRYAAGEITVPDLTGRTPREAADILAELGLIIRPAGEKEQAVKQDPPPGSKVSPGATVTVYFE